MPYVIYFFLFVPKTIWMQSSITKYSFKATNRVNRIARQLCNTPVFGVNSTENTHVLYRYSIY